MLCNHSHSRAPSRIRTTLTEPNNICEPQPLMSSERAEKWTVLIKQSVVASFHPKNHILSVRYSRSPSWKARINSPRCFGDG